MKSLYLKFTDETQFNAVLPVDEETVYPFHVDVIGDIYNKDAVYDYSGDEPVQTTPPTKQDGYFVNIYYQGEKPTGYEAYEIEVNSPNRMCMGG